MRFLKIIKKSIFYVSVFSFSALNIQAQVVTPSLDPTAPVELPAAAGWRDTGGIGVSYYESSGNREKEDGMQLHKTDTTGTSINAAFKVGKVFIDSYFANETTEVQYDQYSGSVNLGKDDSRINFALAGSESVVVGLGGHNTSSRDRVDATYDSATTTVARIGGSVSVKMGNIYAGGGYQRVKQDSNYQVENTWDTMAVGLAFKVGEPGETRFRMELSVAFSDQTRNYVMGLEPSEHAATSTSRYGAEIMFDGLLFTFQGYTTKEEFESPTTVNSIDYYDKDTSGSDVGILWIPVEGLILGFHFSSYKMTFADIDESSEFRINLGYLF